MADNLVVVESPAKAKTIKRYLGAHCEVLASYGHVRDLLPKEGAVEPAEGFAMHYELIEKNIKHVETIAKAMRKAKALYLATDLDREGEAISWHLREILKDRAVLNNKPVYRIVFHEITKRAIEEAMQNPRELSLDLVNAQQARRSLDYLVGFNLSPLLWKKIRQGLSAGRVQSPALRMIVEREEEIEAFKPREYWTIEADLSHAREAFVAKLIEYHGEKLKQFSITTADQAEKARHDLLKRAAGKLTVTRIEKKQRKRSPAPPFITSTVQQEGARKLGFTAQRTMRIAQQLYEGIDIGEGSVGLITYMRTDSVNLAAEAMHEIRTLVSERYGVAQIPAQPRRYKTKAKNAQEAHEAIRPTAVTRTPPKLKSYLSPDQYKLYELIWKRTVACQMIDATIDTLAVDLGCGEGNTFRATGSTIADPGFMVVYQEGRDETRAEHENAKLPPMKPGDHVALTAIRAEQHFTEPPPRYTEATLVKSLEEYGIGRPSTYASIISTLQQREYVTIESKRFNPTDIGRIVSRFLTEHFTDYVNYDFTARLEDDLDAISRGEKEWIPVMEKFWEKFKPLLDTKAETVKRKDVTQQVLEENCPKCGKSLVSRLGRRGRFIGCTGYPECDYTRDLEGKTEPAAPAMVEGRNCPECQSPLIIRQGRYGKFIGCSTYPQCRYIEPMDKPVDTGVSCPQCRQGSLLRRKSRRRGKAFYSCSTYPNCNYAVWHEPMKGPCPQCGWPILTVRTKKKHGTERVCPQKHCDFAEPYAASEPMSLAS
jgi:DNA topoisomerase I